MNQPLAIERQQQILDSLEKQGRVIAQQLAQRFGVSIDTIRRDLTDLATQNLLVKVHGGAVKKTAPSLPRETREHLHKAAKTEIGKLCAALIKPGQTVFFDNSTTVLEIVRHIPQTLMFTGITHSLPTAVALASLPNANTIMIGGQINQKEMMCADTETIARITNFRPDIGFLGICAIHVDAGITTDTYEDMLIKQAIVNQSQLVVAPVSPDKFNQSSPYLVCPVSAIDILALDKLPDESAMEGFIPSGVQLLTPAKEYIA
ncbi:DeoR/GlpR family DNA-binding transcription regulator [Leeia sp. TBRC 13508]|uniref:DeoR/GlpR family DNA-binding transcription regulator n=1 Tax=Leeia speluncae TaxID=2884804 RepID=A0ABS8DB11_9NEIS|nr:DeoR/GlpR family DNA-binding transcription regulator [Leeia speluncae]MCB6185188.1 DeoR/GlpR family DNA-binding transcription regulator [Leeia speluncae]